MVLEKAMAKLVGNYDLLQALTPNDAMFILTGGPGFSSKHSAFT
jgi:hypothetical protein